MVVHTPNTHTQTYKLTHTLCEHKNKFIELKGSVILMGLFWKPLKVNMLCLILLRPLVCAFLHASLAAVFEKVN